MDEVDPAALGDIAYGIFENLLHRELRSTGRSLYRLVEDGADISADLERAFADLSADYPPLAAALIERFGTVDAILEAVRAGEGVVPTRTTQMYWIVEDAPEIRPDAVDDELAGKWLIFLPADEVDTVWRRVRDATAAGDLGQGLDREAKPRRPRRPVRRLRLHRRLAGRGGGDARPGSAPRTRRRGPDRVQAEPRDVPRRVQQKGKTGYVLQRLTHAATGRVTPCAPCSWAGGSGTRTCGRRSPAPRSGRCSACRS
jgi:hypothetical protein